MLKEFVILAQLMYPEPRQPAETLYDYYTRQNNFYEQQRINEQLARQQRQLQQELHDLEMKQYYQFGCKPGSIIDQEVCD